MPTLQVLATGKEPNGDGKEIFACAFTPDSGFCLTGSWDAKARLWDATTGQLVSGFEAGNKPLSAVAITPDGKEWYTGSMDGLLMGWDAISHQQHCFLALHTRPLCSIAFAGDGQTLATASWDKKLTIRSLNRIREGQTLAGHDDIVAGCEFFPDLTHLLSWSHDGTLRIWDVTLGKAGTTIRGHEDRINQAAISPDGRLVVSASRDLSLKLWDWRTSQVLKEARTNTEVRSLFFLPDSKWLVSVDREGWITLFTAPELETEEEMETELPVQCAALAPSGTRCALGGEDGRIMFIEIGGIAPAPIPVTAQQKSRLTKSGIMRILGKSKITKTFSCTCPVCRKSFELENVMPGQPAPCPNCRQALRFSAVEQSAS